MSISQERLPGALKPPNSPLEYLIGWICILPNEYYEAIKMFDERYDTTHIVRGRGDKNSYDVGRIGNHLVVMNCPACGTSGQIRATKIASDMKSTFPAIRFVFLVGIGGASPFRRDVRLGDVVLGAKVLPYMQGRQTDHGFQITGREGVPPPILQTAITRLGAQLRQGLNLQKAIEMTSPNAIERPETDNLYKASYIHCNRCDCTRVEAKALGEIRNRCSREGDLVRMHQGIVGSADQVMKNAGYRDQYATDYDIICFEMEAIGVMETTSCITVRGISDYSDGHKNDDWHSYASLSAAVCAKELLKIISIQSLSECPMEITQDELERSVKGAVYQVSCSIHQSPGPQKEYQMAQRNHDTIVERYGFVQDLIVPNLYELTQGTSSSEDIEHVRGRIAAMEILQQDLEKSLDSVRSQVRKQAKRRQNSDVMRQNWKTLRYKVDSSARWVAEVSKVTHHVLANTASKSRRFFISAGKKGNRTFQDAGHAIQDSSLQAIEHLKHLMEHFKIHFLAHRKEPRVDPNEEPPKYSNEFENIPIPELSKSSLQYDVAKSGQWSESSSSVESMGMDEIRHFPVSVRHPPSSQQLNVDSIEPVFSSPSSAIIPRQASNLLPPPPSSPPPPPPSQQPVNNSVRDSSDLRSQPKERPPIPPPRRPGINAHRESEDGRSSTDAPSMSSGFSDDAERHGSAPTTPSSDDCTLASPSVSDLVAKWQTKKSVMGRPRFEQ